MGSFNKWLVADISSAGSPDREDRQSLIMIFDIFWPIQVAFVGDNFGGDFGSFLANSG